MAQVYSFVDENGVTRLFAEIHPDPAGTPFNGGTITDGLVIAPVTDTLTLELDAVAGQTADVLDVNGLNGGAVTINHDGVLSINQPSTTLPVIAVNQRSGNTGELLDFSQNFAPFATLLRVQQDGALGVQLHAAPADANVATGECVVWFDQTNGAAKLMLKGKTANGTVVAAAIALA